MKPSGQRDGKFYSQLPLGCLTPANLKVHSLILDTDRYGGCTVNWSNEYFFTSLLQNSVVLNIRSIQGQSHCERKVLK